MKYKNQLHVVRRWRKDHKERGLCIECCQPAEPGKIRCQKHLDMQVDQRRGHNGKITCTE